MREMVNGKLVSRREVSDKYGVSRERVRQLIVRYGSLEAAIGRLKIPREKREREGGKKGVAKLKAASKTSKPQQS